MKTILALFLFTASLQVAPTPEEMYGMYDKDGKYRELTEQVEQMAQRMEEAEKEEQGKKMLVLLVSLLIGLIPIAVVGGKVVSNRTWKTDRKGTAQALAIACAGGAALFAFNYGWFYLKILHEEIFKLLFSFAVVLLLIGIGIYLVRNKKKP